MKDVHVYEIFRMRSRAWVRILPGIVLLVVSLANAADLPTLTEEQRSEMLQAMPTQAQVTPAKPRRLLILSFQIKITHFKKNSFPLREDMFWKNS